ncbi:MAG: AhpC/TSA family protein [Prevotellaceae bacterium]|jgi:peroxiredoxin|nr:AhpC/TSA family protein [Prevotellaceae bacterium]
MKKLIYLIASAAVIAACSNNNSYRIKGSVEGASDGDIVYLQKAQGQQLVKMDSAIIKKGEFAFEGVQDTAVNCYLTYKGADKKSLLMDFFLENGNIYIQLSQGDYNAIGTPNNNIYQEIRKKLSDDNVRLSELNKAAQDTTLTQQARDAKQAEMDDIENEQIEYLKQMIAANITNPVGVYLLKDNYYYYTDANEIVPLMAQIPAAYRDAAVVRLEGKVEKMKATAAGVKFTDFEMKTPDDKPIKLSDYAGKGKIVLVDFWASWCPPCRREMPTLVKLYAQYQPKGFEIVGVSLDRTGDAWKKGIKDLNITWPQMSDLKYWNSEGAALYAVSSIPHLMLIDGNGNIIARGLSGEEVEAKLATLLK